MMKLKSAVDLPYGNLMYKNNYRKHGMEPCHKSYWQPS